MKFDFTTIEILHVIDGLRANYRNYGDDPGKANYKLEIQETITRIFLTFKDQNPEVLEKIIKSLDTLGVLKHLN